MLAFSSHVSNIKSGPLQTEENISFKRFPLDRTDYLLCNFSGFFSQGLREDNHNIIKKYYLRKVSRFCKLKDYHSFTFCSEMSRKQFNFVDSTKCQ